MGAYNRNAIQPVVNFIDPLAPQLYPLEVTPLGGTSPIASSVGAGNTQILAAPGAGTRYRLHRFSTNGPTLILQGVGTGAYYGQVGSAAGLTLVDNLHGLMCAEALQIVATGVSGFSLFYDLVTTPLIQ